jgi:hypothetical protein
MGVQLKTAVL